jgi:MFS superfamily sulfate permease-like transporter
LSFSFFKKIPPTLVVLVVAVVLGQFFHLFDPAYTELKPLISPVEFTMAYHADFGGMSGTLLPVFIKYVMMFAIVGSLESILTVRKIDILDPYGRKTNLNLDTTAVGAGNVLAGLLGGLPMISEVARSSSNIKNGGKTRWSNLFQGMFLLIFLVAFSQVVKMIPVAALAAILIFVGFRLVSSFGFKHRYSFEKEQLLIFLVTIIATLSTNLLIGIGAGILTKVIVQLFSGVKLSNLFKAKIQVRSDNEIHYVNVPGAAVFTNYPSLKLELEKLPKGKNIQVDFSDSPYVDLTVMENVTRFKNDYESAGGHVVLLGLGNHEALSDHPLAAKKNQRVTVMS